MYKTVRTDRYHYMMMHTARQGKSQNAQPFADRSLCNISISQLHIIFPVRYTVIREQLFTSLSVFQISLT